MAGAPRGEVRLELGILRCYPDPGPRGFDTEPPQTYQAGCPSCGAVVDFFRLRFPDPNPMRATCPGCGAGLDISLLRWSPQLPVARAEVTFGGLEGRPSLARTDFFRHLEQTWGVGVAEAHVTL
ncbi:MAG TPA: hypothetical protein VI138_08055 [Candidatus Dormibacteraeota bacterium]